MKRRHFLGALVAALAAGSTEALANHRRRRRRLIESFDDEPGYYEEDILARYQDLEDEEDEEPVYRPRRRSRRTAGREKPARKTAKRGGYRGKQIVSFRSGEAKGTIIIRTGERALYYVLGGGKAIRYGVAVGKQGFQWSGTARIGNKVVNPSWTPPEEMIERKPELAEWAGGMPGGIPENPLGVRALYLYKGRRDTLYRIHGTNAPGSIGTAASSGCIRMLNSEVVDLYGRARIGTKVIVQ